MGLSEWVENFRTLHQRAREGKLNERELIGYQEAREELAKALITAQRLTLKPGETARSALRVARALQADLEMSSGRQRAMTLDLSMSGFAAMLGKTPEPSEKVSVTLRMPGSAEPLVARAGVASIKRQSGSYRVSFTFETLPAADQERLGFVVFDTAIEQIGG